MHFAALWAVPAVFKLLFFSKYIKLAQQHQDWLEDLVIRLLCVFALDRFGDFVSDEVRQTFRVVWTCLSPVQ